MSWNIRSNQKSLNTDCKFTGKDNVSPAEGAFASLNCQLQGAQNHLSLAAYTHLFLACT